MVFLNPQIAALQFALKERRVGDADEGGNAASAWPMRLILKVEV